ncbi:alpha/beta fold hydrolase [Halalkalibacter krulwichiae]|uniref:Poly-beta-hydroxybutyrate polymerase n=1 Tax=Halalkalibacter krulwichiae TaxID=199441 RepID=A0A1X9MIF3_9BACI|nr:alpha/beta fold hydrolase [Halalkalibacter krulwichiae]ARK30382.1 Poly-beta-hydroxybutyrate polymerase [Halalkalibacter krulwichiae]
MGKHQKLSDKARKISTHLNVPSQKVALTPKTIVWNKNKVTLWHYPAVHKKYETPLFLVYSLINEPYILDLAPGMSMIESFVNAGYDVYLLDFGRPGYEDKDTTLDDYVIKYIQKGVHRCLYHSKAGEITLVGYCLGGTLATIYAAISKEPIKNIVLFVPPLDFGQSPILKQWEYVLDNGELELDQVIDEYGIIPSKMMEHILRLATSPVTYSSYLSLLQNIEDEDYVKKWRLINKWLKDQVPFVGATLKQIINELVIKNKLINNNLFIDGQRVNLANIDENLLVIATSDDKLVPEELIKPIMEKVSSEDKRYKNEKGGHVSLALRGELPDFLKEWLHERSIPLE